MIKLHKRKILEKKEGGHMKKEVETEYFSNVFFFLSFSDFIYFLAQLHLELFDNAIARRVLQCVDLFIRQASLHGAV